MSVFDDTRKLAEAIGLRLPPEMDDTTFGIVVRTATARLQENWADRVAKDDAFTPAAIAQDVRDRERFDAGYKAGYEAAELRQRQLRETDDPVMAEMERRRRLLEAYRLVKADLESFPGPTPRACLGFAEGRIDALEYAE